MFLRVADPGKEPFNTIIDTDSVCFPKSMFRILKLIPVFNIVYGYWTGDNVQLDTVIESLKNCDTILPMLQKAENQGDKYVNSYLVNQYEELRVIQVEPLKDMLSLYKKYRDEMEIVLCDNDMTLLFEYFYEFVRKNCFPDKTGRLNSVFFYDNLEVVADLIKEYGPQLGKICEAEFVETRSLDRYDLGCLSDIRPTSIFKECQDAVMNYWNGEITDHPTVEYLFSGKYILKELK